MEFTVIVFDFDGTLVDSQPIKLNAFHVLFRNISGIRDRTVVNVIKSIPEESRYVIIKTILEKSGKEYNQKKINHLAEKYNSIVLEAIKDCDEKSGATKLLKAIFEKYNLYVNSITPVESLSYCVRLRGWNYFFKGIFGYPLSKKEALEKIIDSEKVDPEEILVVGDGETDKVAAVSAGCYFYQVKNDNSLNFLRTKLMRKV